MADPGTADEVPQHLIGGTESRHPHGHREPNAAPLRQTSLLGLGGLQSAFSQANLVLLICRRALYQQQPTGWYM
jgi:hypothetical protein